MTTATRERREVGNALPTHDDGKVDLVQILELALTVPGRLSQCYNKFHRYSILNMILVYLQTKRLEPMATFKRWADLKRSVVKGSKALFVNHPVFAPVRDENGNTIPKANGKGVEMKVVGFRLRPTVFQLSQTDGPELSVPEVPDWDKAQAMEYLEITEVKFSHGDGNTQGYSAERTFALNPVAVQPFKTMIHEWAHILLGHTAKDFNYPKHRGVAEFQAEATALLVCRELGVDFAESECRAYIQHWLDGREADYLNEDGNLLVTDTVVRHIFSTTDKILVAGRKAHYDKMSESEAA